METIKQDSTKQVTWHYDSIYIDRYVLQEVRNDTITINDTKTEYRFKHIRDTIRIIRRDSIPYPVRVTETKEVFRVPPWGWVVLSVLLLTFAGIGYKVSKS